MSRHERLSLRVDMIEHLGETLIDGPALEKTLIIFPGKRPAHFLRKYLADRLETAFVPPAIVSVDEFVELMLRELGWAKRTVEAIDCLAVLHRLNLRDQCRVVGQQQGNMALDEFLPWGFELFADFEEMMIAEVPVERLKTVETVISEGLPRGVREKLGALAGLYAAFYEHLEKNGLATRSLKYREAAARASSVKLSRYDRIVVAGFFAPTPSEKRIFTELARDKRSSFIFQEGPGIDRVIGELGFEPEKIGDPANEPAVYFHKAFDGHAEVFGLADLIRREKDLGEHDVIVVPRAETLFPVINCCLGLVDEHNISMGYPVFRTPLNSLVSAVGLMLENRQGSESEPEYLTTDYLRLVLHPYVKNVFLDGASYPTRIMFHAIEEVLVNRNQRYVRLDDVEKDREALVKCAARLKNYEGGSVARGRISDHLKAIHDVVIRPFGRVAGVADCCKKLLDAVSFISRRSPANEHPYTAPFLKTVIGRLYALMVSDLGPERLESIDDYFRLIQGYLSKVSHPFSGTPVQGLQVLGFLETRNIKFKRVFLLDANESVLPGTQKEDSILPYGVRRALNLVTHEDRERMARYYFNALIGSARAAHVFYVEAEDREKSRFVEQLIWDVQKRTRSLDDRASEVHFKVDFMQPQLKPVVKSPLTRECLADEKMQVYSASSLNDYLRCQLIYYYRKVLGIKERDEIGDEPDPMGVGEIVHEILLRFFVPWIGSELKLSESDRAEMDGAVEEVFKEYYRDTDRGAIYLVKSQVKRRLRLLVDFHRRESGMAGTKILECENLKAAGAIPERIRLKYAPLATSDGRAVRICGRLDRVDDRGGSIRIVDYKTGAGGEMPSVRNFDLEARADWPRTLKSVQLPLYIHLYLEEEDERTKTPVRSRSPADLNTLNSGLMLIGAKEGIKEQWLFPEKMKEDERRRFYDDCKKAIARLIAEIQDPELPFAPPLGDKPCPSCVYKTICGRQYVVKAW